MCFRTTFAICFNEKRANFMTTRLPLCIRNCYTLLSACASVNQLPVIIYLLASCYCHLTICSAHAQNTNSQLPEDLTNIELEKLLNLDIELTSPSKKGQKLSEISSAVFVLTSDDIRRSGVTHVAEALRLVPGLNVTRVASDQWAISSRGFNQTYADKLLVLLDGQSIFVPLVNGVLWELHEISLEDVDRIEVIRGPGGAIWGANAVNGVINIISKHGADTRGVHLSAGAGNEEKGFLSGRFGDRIGEDTYYRAYSRSSTRDSAELLSGTQAHDAWRISTAGFRLDSYLNEKDSVFLRSDFTYSDAQGLTTIPNLSPYESGTLEREKYERGASVNSKWKHIISNTSQMDFSFDHRLDNRVTPFLKIETNNTHIEYHHRFQLADIHDISYGLEYRLYSDSSQPTPADKLDPASRSTNLYTLLLHDDISIFQDIRLTLGTKLEQNDHTGLEFMPNVRLLWRVMENSSMWFAISRAVSTPSRVADDAIVPVSVMNDPAYDMPIIISMFGNRDVEARKLLAFELGTRSKLLDNLSIDLATFYNDYNDVYSLDQGEPYVGLFPTNNQTSIIVPIAFGNELSGSTTGAELVADWRIAKWWRLIGWYSYITINLDKGASADPLEQVRFNENSTPSHQFHLRNSFNIRDTIEIDQLLRYIDRIVYNQIPSYTELDIKFAYFPCNNKNLELAIIGQNLFQNEHGENVSSLFAPLQTQIERGAYAQITWRY